MKTAAVASFMLVLICSAAVGLVVCPSLVKEPATSIIPTPIPALPRTSGGGGSCGASCPKDGTYYYCQEGEAQGGCNPGGPFMNNVCSSQCST
ncbi:hypothetical protein ABBQ32_009136 [Trebouxia sp. C0010 RCD-2024]